VGGARGDHVEAGEILGEPEAGQICEGGPANFFLVHGDAQRVPL
jgi:hypothetical protein